ncbi:MAG: hypothetical protein GY925_05880 [Actinomycetia bacterium]|nr:hypothetical protein [Actinomycetes bacterium]
MTYRMTTNGAGAALASGNQPPTVSAGANRSSVTGATVTLAGSGIDDGQLSALTYSWAQTDGATAAPSNSAIARPTVTFPTADTYVYELTVDDGQYTATDQVVITVSDAPAPGTPGTRKLHLTSASWTNVIREAATRLTQLGHGAVKTQVGQFAFSNQATTTDTFLSAATSTVNHGKRIDSLNNVNPGAPWSLTWQPTQYGIYIAKSSHADYTWWKNRILSWGNTLKARQDAGDIGQITCAPGHENVGKYASVSQWSVFLGHTPADYAYWFCESVNIVRSTGADVRFAYAPNNPSTAEREQGIRDSVDAIDAIDPSAMDVIGMSYYPRHAGTWIDDDRGGNPRWGLRFQHQLLSDIASGRPVIINECGIQRTTKHLDNNGNWYTSGAENRIQQMQDFFAIADEVNIDTIKLFSKAKVNPEEFRMFDDAGSGQKRPTDYSLVSPSYSGQYAYTQTEQDTFLNACAAWLSG